MSKETESQARIAADADFSAPVRVYDHPSSPIHYPASYFVRKLTMLRLGAGGVPEVVTA